MYIPEIGLFGQKLGLFSQNDILLSKNADIQKSCFIFVDRRFSNQILK